MFIYWGTICWSYSSPPECYTPATVLRNWSQCLKMCSCGFAWSRSTKIDQLQTLIWLQYFQWKSTAANMYYWMHADHWHHHLRPAALPQRFVSCPQIHNTVKVCGEWHIVISVSVFINVSQLKLGEKYATGMPSRIAGWEVYCISWSVSIVTPSCLKAIFVYKVWNQKIKDSPII